MSAQKQQQQAMIMRMMMNKEVRTMAMTSHSGGGSGGGTTVPKQVQLLLIQMEAPVQRSGGGKRQVEFSASMLPIQPMIGLQIVGEHELPLSGHMRGPGLRITFPPTHFSRPLQMLPSEGLRASFGRKNVFCVAL